MSRYDDILDLPHHVSSVRQPMPRADRAAQFAPFAALTGYGEIIDETGRLTDVREEADEARLAELDEKLREVMQSGGEATLLCFVEDARKQGGRYELRTGRIRKVVGVFRRLVLEDGSAVDIENIVDIS